MKLHIENLAKIGIADIKLDGITVIVGDNNTGKSTIGKALWAMFDIFNSYVPKLMSMRCIHIIQQLNFITEKIKNAPYDERLPNFIEDLLRGNKTFLDFKAFLINYFNMEESKTDWSKIENVINTIRNITDKELLKQIIYSTFFAVFYNQYLSYYNINKELYICLTTSQGENSLKIHKDEINIINAIELHDYAYFIENPSQLIYLENNQFNAILQIGNGLTTYKFCQSILYNYKKNVNRTDNAIDELLRKKKFDEIEQTIINLMGGSIDYKDENTIRFISKDFPQFPLHLTNLSQGVKFLGLLQVAFKNGTIKEGDVLILDEPEIHLHPDWQIKYAELVVLLQKAFNLTVLLTTHSPEFAQAIHLYSQIHGLSGELNAYISKELEDGTVTMKEVPQDDWDDLFEKFANSIDTLMALRSDLENPDSDSEDLKSETEGQ